MPTSKENYIFKNGSKTFYYSSLLFPAEVKDAVYTLYAYVRKTDDLIDSIPQQTKEFRQFKKDTLQAFKGNPCRNDIIDRFYTVCQKYQIPYTWVNSFLTAMEADTKKNTYATYKQLENYMYGSAEVIGLMMAKILQLPKQAYPYAAAQGKAMQLINFIRDIKEDELLGRQYLPLQDMKKMGLSSLSQNKATADKEAFVALIKYEIQRYTELQTLAAKGYKYIPRTYRIAIKTAADMYNYTAQEIKKNPYLIYQKKVKPSKLYILAISIKNSIHEYTKIYNPK